MKILLINCLTDTGIQPEVIDLAAQYPIGCIMFGDDWGQQKGLIMGPRLWKRFIKPRFALMYEK